MYSNKKGWIDKKKCKLKPSQQLMYLNLRPLRSGHEGGERRATGRGTERKWRKWSVKLLP